MATLGATAAVTIGALAASALLLDSGARTAPPLGFGPPEMIARTDDQQLAVTMLHDGRYVRVEHGVVTVLTTDGSRSRPLNTPAGLTPTKVRPSSVAGQVKVYAAGAPGSWWLVPVDGGVWRSLLEDPSCTSEVDISPDETQLAIARGGELRVHNLATHAERTLLYKAHGVATDDVQVPSWSPDGKRLVVNGEISIIDVDRGQEIYHGHVGTAAAWLDIDHVVYVTRTWLRSEIHLIDLHTGTDRIALEMEGAIWDLATGHDGLFIRRDEFHSRTYLTATAGTNPRSVEDLTQLDTGSAIDFLPAGWTRDGAVLTLATVPGQRGLMRTVPGQCGMPLILHHARNILLIGNTQQYVLYSLGDGDDCETHIFDLGAGTDRLWFNSRCAAKPYITCAWLPQLCLVADDTTPQWFDPSTMRFGGPAPHLEAGELLSPDATASVRIEKTIKIRNFADGTEAVIAVPPVDGSITIGWGSDSNTLIAVASAPGHHRLLVGTLDGHWRTIIDEPHRSLNGYAVSPDGSRIAVVALLPGSTWSYLPFTSPLRR
jgi:WD40 repeat protein